MSLSFAQTGSFPHSITGLYQSSTSPNTSLVLTWVPHNPPNHLGYTTYVSRLFSTSTANFIRQTEMSYRAGQYTFNDLIPGETYTVVHYCDVKGLLSKNTISGLKTFAPNVTGLSVSTTSTRSLVLTWTEPSDPANPVDVSYKVRLDAATADNNVDPVTATAENHTFTDLLHGEQYTGVLWAVAADGTAPSDPSTSVPIYTEPMAPSFITVAPGVLTPTTSLDVTWPTGDNNDDSVVYKLRMASNGTQGEPVNVETALAHTLTGLDPGREYTVTVWAETADGIKNSTETESTSGNTAPLAVTDLTAQTLSTSSIRLMWTVDPNSTQDSFEVTYVHDEHQATSAVAGSPSDITGLVPGVTYTFSVRAKSGTVLSLMGVSVQETTVPSQVSSFSGSSPGPRSVDLAWEPGEGLVQDGYSLRYRGSFVNTSWNDISNVSKLEHNVTDLYPGEKYVFEIIAHSKAETSSVVTTEVFTLPLAVEDLIAQATSTSSVRLTWAVNPNSTQDSFQVVITYTYGGGETRSASAKALSGGLIPGVTYTLHVLAKSGTSYSESGQSVQVTTIPSQVNRFTAFTSEPHKVNLTWEAGQGLVQDGYSIRYTGTYIDSAWHNISTGQDLQHSVGNLHPGDKYTFFITATSKSKTSAVKNTVVVTPPYNPENVSVVADGLQSRSIAIEWNYDAKISYNTGWRVTYTPQGGPEVIAVENLDRDTHTITISPLTPGQHYTIKVQGRTVDNVLNATGVVFAATTRPQFLSDMTLAETTTSISLTYTEDTTDGIFDNYIFSIDPGTQTVTNARSEPREATFTGLTPGSLYTIEAVTQSGQERSVTNQRQEFTFPSKPKFTCVPDVKGRYITIYIQRGIGAVDEHIITCHGEDGCQTPQQILPATELDTRFDGLTPLKTYNFTITAIKRFPHVASEKKQSAVFRKTCLTSLQGPGLVQDFQYDPHTLKPFEVLLSWTEPRESSGVIVGYTLVGQGVKTIYAMNDFDGAEATLVVVTPIIPPFLEVPAEEGLPSVPVNISETDPDPIQHDSIALNLINPFSDRNGEVTEYSVIVWSDDYMYGDTDRDRPLTDSDTWYTRARSKTRPIAPYQTIRCSNLFTDQNLCFIESDKGTRRRRAVGGSNTEVIIGGDSTCDPEAVTHQYCNGPLEPGTGYRIMVRAHNELGQITDGYTSMVITTKGSIDFTPTVLVAVVAVPLLMALLAIVLCVFWRRGKLPFRSQNTSFDTSPDTVTDNTDAQRHKVNIDDFANFMSEPHTLESLTAEYKSLATVGNHLSCQFAELDANFTKNKSTTHLPYDHSLVKLADSSQYINASWMPGYNHKREFIVTQCPLQTTTDEFWRMIWEHEVQAVVMVVPFVTEDKMTCNQYWPTSEAVYSCQMKISVVRIEKQRDFTITNLRIDMGDESRGVTHYQFVEWPRIGVPQEYAFVSFVKHVRREIPALRMPTVVHCSAGVGPSAVFIAVDHALQAVEDDIWVDLYGIALGMRLHRPMMIDTQEQYVYIHRCLLSILKEGGNLKLPIQESRTG